MSALTVSLAAYDAQHPTSPPPVLPVLAIDPGPSSPGPSPPPSSSPSSSQLSTLTSSSADSSSSAVVRANEHLAVLLPRHLWKEDGLATACDNFHCRVRFSLFERRHHCRKCGSIFCRACTSHTTALLDTSSPALPFTHPPHRTPIALYASKDSPVIDNARVCAACYDQIHGIPRRHDTPQLVASRPRKPKTKPSISSLTSTTSASSSGSGSGFSSDDAPATPASPSAPRPRTRSKRRISLLTSTQPTLPADVLAALSSLSHHNTTTVPAPVRAVSPASDGPLAVYPLTRHSAVCKAMGGGRWTPTPSSHSPLHSPLYMSPLHSPLHTSPYNCDSTGMWSEKGAAESKGYFDLGEIVSDEAGFRYRRAPHMHVHAQEEGVQGVRPF